jgi:glycerol-3-phosphate dehydrogenase
VTITGGKWTTYRLMAEDAINRAVDSFFLTPDRECQTDDVRLIGAEGWCVSLANSCWCLRSSA